MVLLLPDFFGAYSSSQLAGVESQKNVSDAAADVDRKPCWVYICYMFSVYSYFQKIVGIDATCLFIYIVEIMCVYWQPYWIGSSTLTWAVWFRKNKRISNIYNYIPKSCGGWCNEGGSFFFVWKINEGDSWSKGCMIYSMWTYKECCCRKDDLVAGTVG